MRDCYTLDEDMMENVLTFNRNFHQERGILCEGEKHYLVSFCLRLCLRQRVREE